MTDKLHPKKHHVDLHDYLLQRGIIDKSQWESIDLMTNVDLKNIASKCATVPAVLLDAYAEEWAEIGQTALEQEVNDDTLSLIPADICRHFKIIPYDLIDKKLVIACTDPHNIEMRKAVAEYYSNIEYQLASQHIVEALIHVYYRNVVSVLDAASRVADDKAYQRGSSEVFDELIDEIIWDGYHYDATDIHIVATPNAMSYRLRTHHQFFPRVELNSAISQPFKNRLLIRAGCPFNKLNHVQDLALRVKGAQDIPVRLSYIPTQMGYSIVLRIIREQHTERISEHFHGEQWAKMYFELQYNRGLILIAGPVGSGKTTFFYGIMKELCAKRKKIISIEDPIETIVKHAFQIDIKNENITFEQTIKIILRQDPDVVMIGEIRADDAVRCISEAKLSGHMVAGTIHAQTPWECLLKLKRLGYPQTQLITQGICIVTTRLVPHLCPACKVEHKLNEYEQALVKEKNLDKYVPQWYRSTGCTQCHFSGVSAIKPFYHILNVNSEVMQKVCENWDRLRDIDELKEPIERLKRKVLADAAQGHTDLKTYFEICSV